MEASPSTRTSVDRTATSLSIPVEEDCGEEYLRKRAFSGAKTKQSPPAVVFALRGGKLLLARGWLRRPVEHGRLWP